MFWRLHVEREFFLLAIEVTDHKQKFSMHFLNKSNTGLHDFYFLAKVVASKTICLSDYKFEVAFFLSSQDFSKSTI